MHTPPSPFPPHTHTHIQLIGLALIGGGSYLVHTGSNLDFFTGSRFFSGAVIIIVAGIITFLITIVGIVGAIMLNKFLLGLVSTSLYLPSYIAEILLWRLC